MNIFTDRNNSDAVSNKVPASMAVKKELRPESSFENKEQKVFGQNLTFPSVKTSPIVVPPATKSAPKRKKRQNWSKEEDEILVELMGKGCDECDLKWPKIAAQVNDRFGSTRTGKQCRERWLNHLRPNIKKGNWTVDEEFMIDYFYKTFGPKWSTMAKLMKNRTDNDIKNKWNSMKRTENAARKRKNPPTIGNSVNLSGATEETRTDQQESSQWNAEKETIAPEQETSGGIQLFTAGKSSNLKFTTEALILPSVTDGDSAENSPVPQKKHGECEV